MLALALSRSLRFTRLLRTARSASTALDSDAAGLATCMGVSSCPELRVVPAAISPMLWFPGRSLQILLPEGLLGRLAPLEVQALIAHELAHVCRRDHWVRRFELLVSALFWWHPVTWWARRAMRQAAEESCDAWVVHALPGHARAYAKGLLKTVEFVVDARSPVPALACGAGGARHLRERLTKILTERVAQPSSRRQRWLLALLAGALLFVVPTVGEITVPAQAAEQAPQRESVGEITVPAQAAEQAPQRETVGSQEAVPPEQTGPTVAAAQAPDISTRSSGLEQLADNVTRLSGKVEIDGGPWQFYADEVVVFDEGSRLVAEGNVIFTAEGALRIAAERVGFDIESQTGTFYNTTFESADRRLRATRMEIDLEQYRSPLQSPSTTPR